MQLDCIAMLKEGVVWDDVHIAAHEIAIDGLLNLGVLQGKKEDILKARTSVAFLPHGLGHYLGMVSTPIFTCCTSIIEMMIRSCALDLHYLHTQIA